MKRIGLYIAGLLMLFSCVSHTPVEKNNQYIAKFTIKNKSATDIAFHWQGMEEDMNRFEYIVFPKGSVVITTIRSEEGFPTLSDLGERIGNVTVFCPSDSKKGTLIDDMFYDESNWIVKESPNNEFSQEWEFQIFDKDAESWRKTDWRDSK